MSKNVAVFVDVANIFYAAKAAGIDIDYVTLLKSATAGRDFVRAYAYTGLDPENENQRQFHSFLARNGYKVISKDIRKYGDGRIKANLDIELVVDLMKTARNLDIAVVVSGDGDFASAIRAVQEQGVRVEVISFRGNTSSDLIDVADQFTDIAQIARVEKGSARSGRRVASEGDLSMTEVPEKETEGAPRRRRGRRDERTPEVAAAAPAAGGRQGNLIVLPGERLSRAPEDEGEELEPELAEVAELADEEAVGEFAGSDNGREVIGEDGRRRRRRRGGRGRGRGRREEGEGFVEQVGVSATADEEDEEFEDLAPAQPPHQTFGSVWDSQIGVPSGTTPAASAGFTTEADDEEEDLEEPEVPEYLLAERRQRGGGRQGGGRGGRTGGRGRSAYQAALDRERYGNRSPQPSFGGGGSGGSGRQDRDRGRDRGRGGRPQQGGRYQDRAPRMDERSFTSEPRSAEPWSEVPPEIEELLRAELARKGPGTDRPAPAVEEPERTQPFFSASPDDAASVAVAGEQTTAEAPVKRTRRPRTTKAAATPASAEATTPEASDAAAVTEEKPKRRTTRSRTATSATAAAEEAAPEAEPKKRTTRRRTTTKAASEES